MKNVYDLLKKIKALGGRVYVEDDKIKLDIKIGALTSEVSEGIKYYRDDILAIIGESLERAEFIQIENVTFQESYPISDAQRRLWVLSQFEGGSVAYNMPGNVYLNEEINIEYFKKAVDAVIARHEILRTVFKEDESGEIRQWVLTREDLDFKIDYKDFRKEKNKEEKVKNYIAEDSYKSFDLAQGPLLRASLLQVEDKRYVFYFNMHHIISDGWSMDVLSKDVFAYYGAYHENTEPGLKELRIQYKDYSGWQLAQQETELFKSHRAYWLKSLEGELPLLDLPSTKKRPRVKTNNGRTLITCLSKEVSRKLQDYCQQHGGTVFMGLLASVNTLLYRYTSQTDIIIGSPTAGRENADLEDQIGFYVNTIALRNEIRSEETFDDLFLRVKQNTLDAYAHQMYPFDRLVEELDLVRDTSRSAVFDVMLVLQNNGEKKAGFELKEGLENQIFDNGSKTSKFDLLISIQEQGDYLSFSVEYNTDVYEKKMIESFIVHYKVLLSKLLSDPQEILGRIDYLSAEEKQKLLFSFNDTKVDYREKTVMELFEEQVAKTPDAIAVIFEEKELSYRELNERSNRLAHILKEKYKISSTAKVGVMLERSLGSVISMIGVMKTSACYVPIDHDYPRERVAYILKDSALKVIISEEALCEKHGIKASRVLDIKDVDLEKGKKSNPKGSNYLEGFSYVIYTSGSTGKPKGVLQTHRMMSNLIQWDIHHSGIETGLKHLQYASFSFDASLHDLYFILSSGGSAYIVGESSRLNYQSLKQEILSKGIEVLSMPFSALNAFCLEAAIDTIEDHKIKYIVSTAEQLYVNDRLEKFLKKNPKIELHNHYGPSESHVVTSYKMSSDLGNIETRASIGQPISNSRIYILDEHRNLVPQGVEGELYIGGENLAAGYLNLEKETKEKFIANPFKAGDRLYKTGDQGYWLPDGNIEFIGRKDDQVKIRGYRIELGEIEHALLKNEAIEEAVVLAKTNDNNEKELVAYLVSKEEQNTSELRSYLKGILPEYMLPVYFVQLEALPLTSNGKIDKKNLPDPKGLGLASGVEYVAPRNEIEEKLVKIWEEILQRENIGVKDDFFALGGHSLKAVRLSNEYQKALAVKISLKDLFSYTSIDSHSALIRSSIRAEFIQIENVTFQESYPISDAQRRLWVLSQFEGGSVAYNMPGSVKLEGEYTLELFQKSVDSLIARHEILRTVFKEDESGEIRQWVLTREDLDFKIDYKDFRKEKNKEEKVKNYIAEDSYKSFDLAQGPLLRASLLQVEDKRYVFYFNMHHIISDGWSMDVLSKDVFAYYGAYHENTEPGLKELRIQYKDYSGWQLAQQETELFKSHRAYWLKSLEGELPLLDLPSTKKRPRIKTYNGHGLSTYIDKATTAKLKKYSQENGGSLFMGLLAVWNILMYRYTSQKDIIIGTPIAGREHADLEDQIGFYVNTLALRNEIRSEETFDDLFLRVKQNTLDAYAHQMYPFDRLVEELNLQRDTSRSAVFDILLTLQNTGEKTQGFELKEEELNRIEDRGESVSKFDINLMFEEIGDYISFELLYNPDVYDFEMAEGLILHYRQLLQALLENPEEKFSRVDYLSVEEKYKLQVTFNETSNVYPKDKTFVDLFAEQVAKTPDHTAIVFGEKELTYKELDERSNQLARYLQTNYKIQTDNLVGIMFERNEWMMVSILAVWKSGGAYVPMDADHPVERINQIITSSNLCVLITEGEEKDGLNVPVIDLKKEKSKFLSLSVDALNTRINPDSLAYVIYTSGSTGLPKGVMIEHLGMLNHIISKIDEMGIDAEGKVAQNAPHTFDISVWQFFSALMVGGTTVIYNRDTILDPSLFIKMVDADKITTLELVPSYLLEMLTSLELPSSQQILFSDLKILILNAETLTPSMVKRWFARYPHIPIVNTYGATEASDDISHYIMYECPSTVTIPVLKRPIQNFQVHIVDENMQLVPVGVKGEILLSGPAVGRGYLNNEEQTKKSFLHGPMPGITDHKRIYRTGDLGCYLPDGTMEFLGRKDNQVKVNGHRVELGEIEHALRSHKEIEEAVVVLSENKKVKELVAYITAKTEQNTSELRSYLKGILPEYMLPVYFVQLEAMPLTPNGKIDKKALPDPKGLGLASGVEYVAPRNEIEEKLVKIWEEILQRENIGVKDDFFALGGHSLKAVRLSNEYQKALAVKISLKDLFSYTSIDSHSALIRSSIRAEFIQIENVTFQESYPISDAQRRLWVLSQFEGGSVAYNMPGNVYLNEEINIEYFKKAVDAVIARHEILRTVFKEDESGEIRQWVLTREDLDFKIDYKDFRKEKNKEEKVKNYIAEDSYKSFDLAQGPLLRASLLQVEDKRYVFYFNMHHIISDGWSMDVLSKDVFAYYGAYHENTEPGLKELRIQYKDYSAWQLAQLESESFASHRAYWLNSLEGELPLLDLPSTKKRPRIKTYNGHGLSTYIDKATTAKLKKYSQENGGSLFMGLLAVWNILMYRYTSQKDIIIGTPIAGREHADLEDQIGFYVNTLALRNEIRSEETFDDLFSRVKQNTLNAYVHQMYPFDRLVEELNLSRDMGRSPLFDVLLDFHNTGDKNEKIELNENEINSILDLGNYVVKYDLELHFTEAGDYISIEVNFNEDVYDKDIIEGVIDHYKNLIVLLINNSNESINTIDFLSNEEKNQLIVGFNDTGVVYPKEKTIIDLFEEQVKKTPDNVAIKDEKKSLTYKELDELSNQLAHCLVSRHSVKSDDLVGIKLDKGEWAVISMLGILKIGAAYVPIDPDYPTSRKQHILSESKIELLITSTNYIFDEEEFNGSILAVDVEFEKDLYSKERINQIKSSKSLAYVIYTSGSTGNPKGVMIDHMSLTNYLIWALSKYSNDSGSLDFGLFTSLSFDLTLTSLYLPLISGGELRIFGSTSDVSTVLKSYFESGIKCIKLTPAHIDLLSNLELEGTSVQLAIVGGDKLENSQVKILRKLNPSIQIYNEYGPTESTVGCTVSEILSDKGDISIGKPISNTQIYILSEEKGLQPVGVPGEICISGSGLARGYLNQEALTREKFIANPFKAGDRLYKTGDLGRWLPDGNIEFIGRKDDQVKIRGYRIELGEIEHALLKNEAIEEAVVLAKTNDNNEKELVAYLVSKEEQNTSELRSYLKGILPEYMLPVYFVQLEAMPLTSNGKIDKKNLPDPEGLGLASGVEYVAPRNEQEKVLVFVWSDVLKREGIGIKDSFYNLGGDSIKSIQVVSRLKQQGYSLKIEHILRTPVVEELARLMQHSIHVVDQSAVKGRIELTPIQEWFFSNPLIKVKHHFNQSILLQSKEAIDKKILEKSISDLSKHHDALRMFYKKTEAGWEQINGDIDSKSYTLDFYDLRRSDNAIEEMSELGEQLQSSIDLSGGPLFRVVHFRLKDGDRLGLILHHLVVDGVSWRILLEDLSSLYTSYKEGKPAGLVLKTDSFQRWSLLQKEYAESNKIKTERTYWEDICSQEIESLFQDKEVEAGQASLDASESFKLDKVTTELLQTRVHGVYNTEINDVLLTGLGLAIKEALSREKSVLKVEGHGREDIIAGVDISRTVGWFTTMYPFVLDVSKSVSQTECLVKVKESLRRVPNKGIGYGILKYLSEVGIESKITPEIVFNYLGDFGSNAGNDEKSLFDYASEHMGSSSSKENGNEAILDISGMLVMGELSMSIRYSKSRYDSVTIKKLVKSYEKVLKSLIKELAKSRATYLTPSDLSFKGLNVEELSEINSGNNVEDVYELSPLQTGIYYHWLSEVSNSLYFEQMSYRIRAKGLEVGKLKRAYDALIARHGVLRTSFSNDYAGRPLQILQKGVPSKFSYEKLADSKDKQGYIEQIKQEDREKGFDLNSSSQMRLHIIDLSEGEYEFIWSHHHILMDGWCMSVLVNDFNQLLSAEIMGTALDMAPVMPYSNYINWLNTIDKESSLAYWKDYLADYTEIAEIPFTIKTEQASYVESSKHLQLDGELFKKVDTLCNQIGITHNTFIQAVWGYLLSRYNNTNDVVFGAVVSGRPADLHGVEDMIGLFINTIPVRIKYESGDTPIKLLRSIQEQSIQSTSHHYLNLSEVQSQSKLGMRLIDHIMIFENYAVKDLEGEGVLNTQREEGLSIESMDVFEQTNYDFNIVIAPLSGSMVIDIKYNSNRYDSLSLNRLAEHFDNLISAFTSHADEPLHKIDYLSAEEKQKLLFSFNDTKVAYPKDKTIIDLFEEQVNKTPNNVAVVFEEKELTYKELDELSNQLADYLQKHYAIEPDDLIGIKQDRSEWMIVSILGVLKSGGAYVPIDPGYPQDRIAYIEQDTNCKVCIDEKELNKFKKGQKKHSREKIKSVTKSGDLAYVIYTSGSTGQPKGVLVEHSGVVNRLLWMRRDLGLDESDVFLQKTPTTFDVSVWELLLPLITGSKLVVARPGGQKDPAYLEQVIVDFKISLIHFVPSMLSGMLENIKWDKFESLRHVICSGEALSKKLESSFKEKSSITKLHNYYGPTEASVDVTAIDLTQFATTRSEVSIGKPVDNTQIYILSEEKGLQPVGVPGEILIGGVQIARGYLNQEALTREKFIANPFKAGDRLYKTGDLGRWLPDGNIEFIGRKDDQVKIRGYRIELGEIEHALLKNEAIEEAVVLAKTNDNNEKELVAYLVSKEEQNTSELRSYLKGILPEYMLPVYFVQLEAMPLTSNGKIDKKNLPDPEGLGLASGVEYVAPRNEQEKVLVFVWSDVLKREGIGIKDSFYNLGGDSIKSIQVVSRLKQQGYSLKIEHILRTPVVEELARLMQHSIHVVDQSAVKGRIELTPIQEWFFSNPLIKVKHHFNQSILLQSKEAIDKKILEKSISDLSKHHDALRMFYKKTEAGWEQINGDIDSKSYTLDFYDLRRSDNAIEEMSELGEQLQSSIDLSGGPLFRVVHFRLKDGDRLGLILHHLVVDGVSWRILLEDLSSLYTSYKEGKPAGLVLKTDSFQRWSLLQKEYAESNKIKTERTYWEDICSQEIESLFQDKEVEAGQASLDASESFKLDKVTTELLQTRVHGVYNTEINDVLLTGLGLAIKEALSREKSVLKVEGHGREDIIAGVDISRTVGWFTTMYPFVLDVSKSVSQTECLVKVKESLRRVPNKGIGYGILKYLSEVGIESKITPEIVFNYLGDFGSNAGNDEKSLFDYASEHMGSSSSKENGNEAILDISGMLVMGELSMSIRYSKSRYDSVTIKKLVKSYEKVLKSLIKELAKSRATYLTPSDLSFKGLNVEELSEINSGNNVEDVYELSPLQTGIYYHWLSEVSNSLYFEQMSYRIRAKGLEVGKLKRAYDALIARHGVLRTSFSNDYAGRPLQILQKGVPSKFSYEKLADSKDKQGYIEQIKQEDREKGFDLNSSSQMRLHIIDLSEGEYEFIWSHHHILMDGWCMSVLVNDFNQLLSAEIMGTALDMAPVMPYSNYINWLNTIDKESSLAYWKDYLADYTEIAEIPFTIKTEQASYVESSKHLQLDGELFKKVDTLCNQIGITHNTFIQAVWGYLLSRYNNTNDVVFGAVVSGRPADLHGVEDMIGLFINTIPVRIKYESGDTPIKLLRSIQEQSIQSTSHHYLNLSEVQSQSKLGMRLIDHIMIFENYAVKDLEGEGVLNTQREEGLSIESMDVFEQTNYDFNIVIAPLSGSMVIDIKYNSNRYDSLSLNRLAEHFDNLISAFTSHADEPLHKIDYLSAEEKQKLLFSFNDTKVAYPKDKTIIDLFEEQVNKTPNNVAVVFEEKELTYKELDELSNQLADYLQKHYAIEPDDLIGIKQDRSEWMIVSILGVLKSGGAYVPIDPGYPQDRIAYIEQDTNCKVCIDEKELNKFKKGQKKHSRGKINSDTKVDNLAYVIYTSGSTGNPKGVLIEHKNVYSFIKWSHAEFSKSDFERVLFTTSLNFDLSVFEIFHTLTKGKELEVLKDGLSIPKHINDGKKLMVNTVPSVVGSLLQQGMSFASVSVLNMAGEPIPSNYKSELKGKVKEIRNLYGPSEDTTYSTVFRIDKDQRNLIGKPISNTQIYILSEEKGLQPVGVPGEICISGSGLARGYLNQEALTREKFIANPFKAGDRLYKTGDLGRWLPDGNIEFIGRKDDQVKIRGYRIELGEIEHALLKNEAIEEAVVLAKTNDNNEKELVAYLVSKEEQNTSELRSYLKGILPEYMLPVYFVQLEAMPLTSNGKIDKKNLPDPEGLGLASGVEYVAPRNEQEKVLVFVWSDVLKREGIGIKDSFYNLGGDSIKSIQVVSRLKQQGYSLKIEHILRTPVVEELARLMQHSIHVVDQSAVKGRIELTPIQEWFFSNPLIKVKHHFNQSILLQSKEAIDKKILEKSISDLSKHHDALRMFYKKTEAGWEQINGDIDSKSYTLDFYDLRRSDNAIEEMSELGEQLQSSIDLSGGPLFRVVHFRLKDGDRLGLILHHLVVDGVSWRILLEDLSSLYTSYKEGKPAGLVLKTDSFQRWSLLQKEYAESNKIKTERTYWEDICSQEIESLFQDKEVEAGQASLDASESFKLDKVTTELLQTRVHGVYNTEINDVLLTGLGLAIKEALSREKSVLKVEGHGREDIIAGVDISRTVGWFTTMYPFVLDVSKSVSQTECLVKVKESLRRVPNKGIGYGILKYLSEVGIESKITPEIVFNYLGDFGSNAGNDEKSLFDYASEHMGSSSSKENGNEAILDISGMLVMGELSMSIRYSKSRYDSVTIKKLVKSYEKVLKSLIKELAKSRATYLTPSDLSFKGLNVEELSEINSGNNVEDVYELSPLQTGIYYHWLSEVSNSLYFEQMSYRIRAKGLEVGKLKRAYDALIARHGVLRTSFSNDYAGRPLQILQKGVPSKFSYEKLADSKDKQGYIEQIKQEDREKGFDLNSSSQMRLHIIDLSEGEYEFIWSHHHILMDGWCMSVLVNDFNQLLSAEIMGTALDMAPVMPYSNYINWLNTIDKESSLAYWKDYLADYTEIAEIPFTIKTEQASYVESSKHLQLDGELFKKVDTLCNQIGITHNTFIQAVWGYLLSRYNNTNDVVFGAVVSGRPADLHGVEDMIGLFINTIPVRIKYESGDTPIKLLRSIQEQSIQSTSHHYLNLSEVQSQSKLGMRLIDHIMIFENYAVKDLEGEGVLNTQREEGLSIESMDVFEQTNYDFNIVIAPLSGSMVIDIKYNSNRYDSLSLNRLAEHFDNLISAFTSHADEPLHKIDYLSAEEKQKLLFSFNDTKVAYPKDKTIIDLFEEQVNKTPNNVAVVFEEKELTYKELDEVSNQLADYLQKHYAIEPDDLIGIKQDRSEWMIVSILGVLKSGGAYVPIDPGYPQDRIAYIEQDTNCKVCIDEKELNKFQESQGIYSKERSSNLAGHNNLAYVMYTSGSTGRPKGVIVEQKSVVRLVKNTNIYSFSSSDKLLSTGATSFDSTTFEYWGPLLNGGQLVLCSQRILLNSKLLSEVIRSKSINIMWFTSGWLNQLIELEIGIFSTLNTVLAGGDKLSPSHIKKLRNSYPELEIINGYGPTENTTFSITHDILEVTGDIPIGKPISNTQIYILSEEKGLQPVGVIGEICIGGSGLARGYLNQEALTREKFIANPFKAGDRLYKTGDLGRWLPDGNVEFIGRKDDQVKIRGYRIELGEIEHALLKNEAIEEAVVLAKTNDNNEKELVAYLVSKEEQNTSELRSYLQGILPEYMVPSYFVQLEALPLTSNGKIDKKNLPDPKGLGLASGVEYVAPRNEIEEKLVKIWEEILQRENIGVKDDFFALGGHSIKVIKMINQINKQFDLKYDLREAYIEFTIELMSERIKVDIWFKEPKINNDYKEIKI